MLLNDRFQAIYLHVAESISGKSATTLLPLFDGMVTTFFCRQARRWQLCRVLLCRFIFMPRELPRTEHYLHNNPDASL